MSSNKILPIETQCKYLVKDTVFTNVNCVPEPTNSTLRTLGSQNQQHPTFAHHKTLSCAS